MMGSGHVHHWVPRKQSQVPFCRGLKRLKLQFTYFNIRFNQEQAYVLTDVFLAYMYPTHMRSKTSSADGSNKHKASRNLWVTVLTANRTHNQQGIFFLIELPLTCKMFCSCSRFGLTLASVLWTHLHSCFPSSLTPLALLLFLSPMGLWLFFDN